MAQDLELLESWLESHLAALTPARRTALARKVGQVLRRANAKRIAANVEPDGSKMQPRKPRPRLRDREKPKSGRMFPKLRLARNIAIRARADGVEVGYSGGPTAHTARAHQFGLVDRVGRTPDGAEVRARFPVRVLLGFAPEDREAILDLVKTLLDGE